MEQTGRTVAANSALLKTIGVRELQNPVKKVSFRYWDRGGMAEWLNVSVLKRFFREFDKPLKINQIPLSTAI